MQLESRVTVRDREEHVAWKGNVFAIVANVCLSFRRWSSEARKKGSIIRR